MNYHKIYDQIIARGKERALEGYKERHHITPRCMGGSDEVINLVDLTPEEHYLCHQLLVKMYPNNHNLIFAVVMMSGHKRGNTTNKLYGWCKRRSMQPRSERTTVQCTGCGIDLNVTKYYAGITKWCSRECRTASGNVTAPCKQCKELFTSKRHANRSFCSHDCTWTYKRENKLFNVRSISSSS
jgi:hypothetical protein